jgi:predicted Zn-dependent protease with MMP-like domain
MPDIKPSRIELTLWSLALCSLLGVTWGINHALASGQLVDLGSRQGRGHLVFRVLARHEIDYCIRIADADKSGFADGSIDEQTKMALSLWLAAAEEVVKGQVTVKRLGCDSPNVDLIVAVEASSKFPDLESFQQLVCNEKKCFSRIILNTAYRDPKITASPAMQDFGLLAGEADASQSLVQLMTAGSVRRMSVYDFGLQEKVAGDKIAGSTYPLLIHELGHAFGLCDTYAIDDTFTKRCDPLFTTTQTSNEQPHSVMKDGGGYLYLTPDDEDGVRKLFVRFSSAGTAD